MYKKISLISFLIICAVSIMSSCGDSKSSSDNSTESQEQNADTEKPEDSQNQDMVQAEEQDPDTAPRFDFELTEYDFGTITEGETVEHTFKFKNIGKSPLIIESTSATCGCTVPEHTKTPVEPDQTGEIKVRFNSTGKSGVQNKTITITANSYPKINKVYIKGEVKKAPEGDGPVKK